jgi:hypothetical protein
MIKTCGVCGHTAEPTWRDGTYYCAACGAVIDMTTPSPVQPPVQPPMAASAPQQVIASTCPICRNGIGNTLVNGRCRCAMCGTMFDYAAPVYQQPGYQQPMGGYAYQQRRAELEQQRKRHIGWGIFWIIFFWPVAIYQFYKVWQVSEEIRNLNNYRY